MIKKIIDFIKNLISSGEYVDSKQEDVIYVAVEYNDLVNEYSISDEYINETMLVIRIYKNNTVIDEYPYSNNLLKMLRRRYPVIYRLNKKLPDKYIMESVIRFEI